MVYHSLIPSSKIDLIFDGQWEGWDVQERVTAHFNMSPFEKTVNDCFYALLQLIKMNVNIVHRGHPISCFEGEPILPVPAANTHCWWLQADDCGSNYALLETDTHYVLIPILVPS